MRGYIKQRGKGSYSVWIELARGADGKRKRGTFTVRGTRKEAEAQLAKRISEIESGDYSHAHRLTVGDLFTRWLAARKNDLSAKTYDRYEGITRDYLRPFLGAIVLRKLTPLHIQDALNAWREEQPKNRNSGRLSQRTVHHIFTTLAAALEQGVRWNLIPRNPASAVTPPSKGHAEIHGLDERGAIELLKALSETAVAVPAHLAIATGLRRGELLALRWDDIDFDRRALRVVRSLEQLKGGQCHYKQPKTKKSRRLVPLSQEMVDVLKRHRAAQNEIRLALGGAYNPEGLVFPHPLTGLPWVPDTFSSLFHYYARKAGFGVSFHGLRHSFATLALRADVPMKVVSDILGHTTTAITADLYTHVLEDSRREGAERVSRALGEAARRAN